MARKQINLQPAVGAHSSDIMLTMPPKKLAQFYHPILDMAGNVVSRIAVDEGGGPCAAE